MRVRVSFKLSEQTKDKRRRQDSGLAQLSHWLRFLANLVGPAIGTTMTPSDTLQS